MTNLTDFGFDKIPTQDKTARVQNIFKDVAEHYDLMNDILSFGIHRLWKREFIREIQMTPHMTLLDVAGGTGDIAYQFFKNLQAQNLPGSVIVCDLNQNMLENGRNTLIDRGILEGITWIQGNAENLPFDSESVDVYTISFGLRNVTLKEQALKEAYRVLKKGGQFLCLEFSPIQRPLLKEFYDFYSFSILPKLGKYIAKNQEAYQYLAESIRQFPDPESFLNILRKSGFKNVSYRPLTGGIVTIHRGWKNL